MKSIKGLIWAMCGHDHSQLTSASVQTQKVLKANSQPVFWSFLGFDGILVIFLGFEGILVIFWVLGVFGHFLGFWGYFGNF